MEKNNQPLIVTAIVGAVVLVVALAWAFTRDTTTEQQQPSGAESSQTERNNNDNGSEDEQQPEPMPQPDTAPRPAPDPTPQPGVLPSNWGSLTPREKTDLNPHDCDHEVQWVSAEDGVCIGKRSDPRPDPVGSELLLELGFERCESSAYSLETYLVEVADRHGEPIAELRTQAAAAGLPAMLSEDCFYSEAGRPDPHKVIVVEESVVDRLHDFARTHDYYNPLLTRPNPTPPGFDSLAERISYAGYRYVTFNDEEICFSAPLSPSSLLLSRLLDSHGYDDYERHARGCHH